MTTQILKKTGIVLLVSGMLIALSVNQARADVDVRIGFGFPVFSGYHHSHSHHHKRHYNKHHYQPKHYYKHKSRYGHPSYSNYRGYSKHPGYHQHRGYYRGSRHGYRY